MTSSVQAVQPQPIKLHLAGRRMSVTRLAEAAGVTRQHLGRVVNGHVEASAKLRDRLALLLGVSTESLFRAPTVGANSRFPGDAALPSARQEP